jgi:hypothetical protein
MTYLFTKWPTPAFEIAVKGHIGNSLLSLTLSRMSHVSHTKPAAAICLLQLLPLWQ